MTENINEKTNEKERALNCGVVRDLLPLYRDGVCGEESRALVERHIAECAECADILEKMGDPTVENALAGESAAVLLKHKKKENRAALTAGLITAGILTVPLIVCLICNLASGHGLSWFYIVFTSLLTAASVTVVPMLCTEYRLSKTIGAFAVSLTALLLSCCLFSGGNWFFVAAVPSLFGLSVIFSPFIVRELPLPDALKNRKTLLVVLWDAVWLYATLGVCCLYSGGRWFGTVAIAVTLGLSAALLPIIIRQIPLPAPLKNHKGLLVMIWDTAWLYILLIDCARYVRDNIALYLHNCVWITAICLLIPWAIFILIRYTKLHPLIKTGLAVLLPTLFAAVVNDLIMLVYLPHGGIYSPSVIGHIIAVLSGAEPADTTFTVTSIVFASVIGVGITLIAIGIARTIIKKNKK